MTATPEAPAGHYFRKIVRRLCPPMPMSGTLPFDKIGSRDSFPHQAGPGRVNCAGMRAGGEHSADHQERRLRLLELHLTAPSTECTDRPIMAPSAEEQLARFGHG